MRGTFRGYPDPAPPPPGTGPAGGGRYPGPAGAVLAAAVDADAAEAQQGGRGRHDHRGHGEAAGLVVTGRDHRHLWFPGQGLALEAGRNRADSRTRRRPSDRDRGDRGRRRHRRSVGGGRRRVGGDGRGRLEGGDRQRPGGRRAGATAQVGEVPVRHHLAVDIPPGGEDEELALAWDLEPARRPRDGGDNWLRRGDVALVDIAHGEGPHRGVARGHDRLRRRLVRHQLSPEHGVGERKVLLVGRGRARAGVGRPGRRTDEQDDGAQDDCGYSRAEGVATSYGCQRVHGGLQFERIRSIGRRSPTHRGSLTTTQIRLPGGRRSLSVPTARLRPG